MPISDIRIDKEGSWSYGGVAMSRQDIVALFYRHLRQDRSGRCFIEIGRQRYPVEVEDTAYVVWAFRIPCLLLSDGSVEQLDPGTLRIGRGNIPYCKVKKGRFEARFSRSGYYQLAAHMEYDPLRDAFFISLNGRPHYIPDAAGD